MNYLLISFHSYQQKKLLQLVFCHVLGSLWTLTNSLHFPENCPTRNNFVQIVKSVLAQRKSCCMKRVSFSIHYNCYIPHLVSSIVCMASKQKVEEIDMCLYSLKVYLPSEVFACETLVVLKLVGRFYLNLPSHGHLPLLKILHLCILCIEDEDLMKLFNGCPVLEELYYEDVEFKCNSLFGICVPTLKRLHVRSFDEKIHINTPLLEYLVLEETKASSYVAENLNKLKEARIGIYFDYENKKVKQNISNLFDGIHKTRFLCFDMDSTEVRIALFSSYYIYYIYIRTKSAIFNIGIVCYFS